ncbi:amino acid ABC transporter substrate-binding protein [Rhizobium oryzicola]|uniref:Amino acid ABC transporter substrate-binding protein n=1 Tax=Rhizobium oryzicola TaxID=1232668 RepID=A0ABT8SZB6_9HYPH|nr:amino acid ABC transporter substrate-binding protein [Rhizobium oryzicola]MDO1583326.1 amino acid ABC transporter substrate-binding protein [Rhizobium oryzicola]
MESMIVTHVRALVQLLLIAICIIFCGTAAAQESSTLERIRKSGVLRVAYGASAPFSYQADDGTVAGYSIDLCAALAEQLRQALQLPKLRTEYIQRTPSNRVQMLNDGQADIECASSSNTPDRMKVATFAPPHFISQTRFVSLAKNNIRTVEDLRGKSVSVVLGTVNVADILKVSREKKLNLVSLPLDTVQGAFDLVSSGRASAFAMDDILLRTMVAATGHSTDYVISTEAITEPTPYGFMTHVDDREFSELVATLLRKIYASPQMPEIYARWFLRPITSAGYCICLPMSDELKVAMGIATTPAAGQEAPK